MKTDQIITLLVQDQRYKPMRIRILSTFAIGLIISELYFTLFLGMRSDFNQAIFDPHVLFKFFFTASIFILALPLAYQASHPAASISLRRLSVLIPPFFLCLGLAYHLSTSPASGWLAGMIGHYPLACLINIPLLAAGPFMALILYLRNGAPSQPMLSGAMAGISSGGLGAFIYAFHCPDDSVLFIGLWYGIALAGLTLLGAFIGQHWLRW